MVSLRTHRLSIVAILLVAVALRVAAFSPYAIHHPDEALQYIEQAHRLAFGTGLVPWEYRLGMRGWLVPLVLAGPMRIGEALAPGSLLYVVLPRATAAVLAFAVVPAAYAVGARVSRAHALVAMAVLALWYESVYFSVHVLTESLAVAAFLAAAALLERGARPCRLVAGGALLMLAAVLRIHYAPAIAAFALVTFATRRRDWIWVGLGALAMAVASSAIDLVMGQSPFGWAWRNVEQNVLADKASQFGRLGPEAYAQMLWMHWQVAAVPILWCAAVAARRFPALAAAAIVNLAVHLAIGHKEYRFILLSGEIAVLLAAIGSADLVERLRDRWRERAPRHGMMLAALVAAWGAASALLAASPMADPGWRRFEGGFQLAHEAAERRVCGVALLGGNYWAPAGHTYLGAIPLYYVLGRDDVAEAAQIAATGHAFDAIIAPVGRTTVPPGYARVECRGEGPDRFCLAIRPGGCRRDAASEARRMQRVMEANGR